MNPSDWLDTGYDTIALNGTPLAAQRTTLNLIGATAADNPTTEQTDITIPSGVASVTATGSIASTGGSNPVISSAALNGLAAAASGTSSVFEVSAATVEWIDTTNSGSLTFRAVFTTSGATPASVTQAIDAGSAGPVDVTIIGNNGTDAGAVSWRGKIMRVGGTVTVLRAFAEVDTWDASSGATTWTTTVSISGTNILVACMASSGAGTTQWTVILQYLKGT